MLEKLVPDKYFKSIYDINYKALKESGIKCLVFDISNTLESETTTSPSRKVKDLFEDLKEMDFKIILLSNGLKKYVIPFKELLCVDSGYLSFKPLKRKYKKILSIFRFSTHEVAAIGDQLFFDILGANRMHFTSILVNPISTDEFAVAKLNRKIENMVINKLTTKDYFKRGRYYE